MKFNVEKLKAIARPMTDEERREFEYRNDNRDWLALSAQFALRIRQILRMEGMTQRTLAEEMDVSPSQITKILSGKENLSMQTIAKVEKAIGRKIISIIDCDNNIITDNKSTTQLTTSPYKLYNPSIEYACDCDRSDYPTTKSL